MLFNGTETRSDNSSSSLCPCHVADDPANNRSCCWGYAIPPEFFLPPPLSSEMLALLSALYALVVVAALLANWAVILVVVWARMLRSFTDAFILSLAVSDLLVAGFNMPIRLLSEVWNEWRLGLAACRLTEYLQGVTIVNNILTLTAIAIDRYLVICRDHRHVAGPRSRHSTMVGLVAVWLLSLLTVVPQLFVTKLDMRIKRDPDTLEITGRAWVCAEVFSDRERRAYTLAIYGGVYVLPMMTMGFAYGSIARRLWRREGEDVSATRAVSPAAVSSASATTTSSTAAATNQSRSYPQFQTALARRRRVTIMMVTLVLAFTLLWLPFFSASLYLEFRHRGHAGTGAGTGDTEFRAARDFLQLVGYSTCCVNPVIYTFLNRNFQDRLCALCCRGGQQSTARRLSRGRARVDPAAHPSPPLPPAPPVLASVTSPHVPHVLSIDSNSPCCSGSQAGIGNDECDAE